MLTILLTLLHIVVAVVLILVVLLQTGKRADLAGAFGGGGSQTAFGTRGAATVLSKATTAAAVLFMLTSLGLSILSSREQAPTGSVLPDDPAPVESSQPAPAVPTEESLPPVTPSSDDTSGDPDAAAGDPADPQP